MYERAYGDKYWEAENLGYAEIAKLVRQGIKDAVKTGVLPGTVKDYTVKTETFAGGGSINVRLLNHTHFWTTCPGDRTCGGGYCNGFEHTFLTTEGVEVRKTMGWILNRYNFDGSEVQVDYFDVNYYGTADIEDHGSRDFRLRETERKTQLRKDAGRRKEMIATIAAKTLYRPGRLRQWDTDRLEALYEKVVAT